MASVYTTEAALQARISSSRLTTLLDRDSSGAADTGVLTAAIERAGRYIDAKLLQRYGAGSIPFAQISASPATPGVLQEIANELVLADLYGLYEPGGRDELHHAEIAEAWLEQIRKGECDVEGVARAKGYESAVLAVYEAEDPVFGGQDTAGLSRTRGI